MKTIIFDVGLHFRGTTTATIDYAIYNEKLLGNKSIISYNKSELIDGKDRRLNDIVDYLHNNFDVICYNDNSELSLDYDKFNADAIYWIKSGFVDHRYLQEKNNLIHCVFNHYQPHGEKYFYVSKWLGDLYNVDYVPHIVHLPKEKTRDLKEELGLSGNFVIGRHGGIEEFSIPFVHNCVIRLANEGVKFVFLNTYKFFNHPNIIYLDSVFDLQEKTNYILSCDLMIQARERGESFGLAICESLFHNIPVLSYGGGYDKHNNMLLEDKGLIYYSFDELYNKVKLLMNNKINCSYIVDEFSPEKVMDRFDRLFLSDI